MTDRQTIYIAAYVKSGSTWATRLLADVLDSPCGGCMPSEDSKEVATEGQDRPGPYIVRKGHFVLIDDDGPGEVVPRPHRLAWRRLTNEKIVFLVRDPRDICVSGAWHWNKSTGEKAVKTFLDRMIAGDVARCGRWDEYVRNWNNAITSVDCGAVVKLGNAKFNTVHYEGLVSNTTSWLFKIFFELNIQYSNDRVNGAIKRQSFQSRKGRIQKINREWELSEMGYSVEQALRRNNMRKGIAGDWKNHFTPEMNERIWQEFGWVMERLGYDQN